MEPETQRLLCIVVIVVLVYYFFFRKDKFVATQPYYGLEVCTNVCARKQGDEKIKCLLLKCLDPITAMKNQRVYDKFNPSGNTIYSSAVRKRVDVLNMNT